MLDKKDLFFYWDKIQRLAEQCSRKELEALLAIPQQTPDYIENDEVFNTLKAMVLTGAKPFADEHHKQIYKYCRSGLLLATLPKDVRDTIRAATLSDKNELTLLGIRFNDKMITVIAEILTITEIQHLNLWRTDLGDEGIIALTQLSLKSLNISSNRAPLPRYERTKKAGFDALIDNKTMTSLALIGNHLVILDDGILNLRRKIGLQHLDITNNDIPFHGVCRILKHLADSKSLLSLNLSDNDTSFYMDEELEDAFRSFAQNTNVTALYLAKTAFDTRCALLLSNNTTITTLDVSETRLDHAGLVALLGMKQLKHLNISGCKISKESKATLVAQELFVLDDEYPYSGPDSFKAKIVDLKTRQTEALKSIGTFSVPRVNSHGERTEVTPPIS